LSSDDVWVFSELLLEKNVSALALLPEFAAYHALLEIFCFSDLQTYLAQISTLPKLNDKQLNKLRLLSLVDLAVYNRLLISSQSNVNGGMLPYEQIIENLYSGSLDSPQVLTDLLIRAIDLQLITGKLDFKNQVCLIS
jgi:COP9 signalosome complex subunit 7